MASMLIHSRLPMPHGVRKGLHRRCTMWKCWHFLAKLWTSFEGIRFLYMFGPWSQIPKHSNQRKIERSFERLGPGLTDRFPEPNIRQRARPKESESVSESGKSTMHTILRRLCNWFLLSESKLPARCINRAHPLSCLYLLEELCIFALYFGHCMKKARIACSRKEEEGRDGFPEATLSLYRPHLIVWPILFQSKVGITC